MTSEREVRLTTYLRDGPGIRYRAVDEAQTGQKVSVIGCADGWCHVLDGGITGYVAQSTIAVPAPRPARANHRDCIVAQEAGYHGSRDMRVCPAAARP